MTDEHAGKVAILYPGDHETRQNATAENNRLAQVFQALTNLGVHAEPAVYHDQFCEEVRRQLLRVDVVSGVASFIVTGIYDLTNTD